MVETAQKPRPRSQTRKKKDQQTGRPSAGSSDQEHGRGTGLRSHWRGVISFSMVTIPVRLYTATSSKDVHFNLLHTVCNSRIRQMRWCPVCDRAVKADELERGFEYSKDRYVKLSDEDLDSLPVASKHTIELSAFVEAGDIDPIYYEKSYYVEPEETGGKSFALLLQALKQKEKTAIAKVALREKEQLCALRAHDGTLVLETLYYADEIRPAVGADVRRVEVGARELDMAFQLIEMYAEPFEPKKYRDTYRDALMEVIEAKVHGEQVVAPPPEPGTGEVIDLMEALRASLNEAKLKQTGGTSGKRAAKKERQAA